MILPTYDERENLPALTADIFAAAPKLEILVVDDASPDGTADWVREAQVQRPALHLLERSAKLGLGSAYRAGWCWALERDYDPILTMDADYSHHPCHLPELLRLMESEDTDVVIGSRYVTGGGVRNWSLGRRLLSRTANFGARLVLRLPARDCTSGFRAYRAGVLRAIRPEAIRAEGYSFLEESLWRVWKGGFRILETPILFEDRHGGVSKISRLEIVKGIGTLIRLRFASSKSWR